MTRAGVSDASIGAAAALIMRLEGVVLTACEIDQEGNDGTAEGA